LTYQTYLSEIEEHCQIVLQLKPIKDNNTKNIPIILLTNLGSLSDIEKALELGVTNYLVKGDYQIKEIVEKIKEILAI
jgi:DNA-binding response OmpR family regulator